jgi:hypothetical protein
MLSDKERREIEDGILERIWKRLMEKERQAIAEVARREATRLRRQNRKPPDLAVWIVRLLGWWAARRVSRKPARARDWQWALLEELCLHGPDKELGLFLAGTLRMARHIVTGKWNAPPRQRPGWLGNGAVTERRGPGGADL